MIESKGNQATIMLEKYEFDDANGNEQTRYAAEIEVVVHAPGLIGVTASGRSYEFSDVSVTAAEAREIAMVFGQAAGMVCANCKHYAAVVAEDRRASSEEAEHGDCSSPRFFRNYHAAFGGDGIPSNGVQVESNVGWGFVVGPDFGCIHFEHKDSE